MTTSDPADPDETSATPPVAAGPDPEVVPTAVEQCRRIAADTYSALGREDWTRATDLIETNWGLMSSYRLDVIRAVADALPEEILMQRPRWATVRRFVSHVLTSPRTRPPVYTRSVRRRPNSLLDEFTELVEASIAARTRGDSDGAARFVADALAMTRTPVLSHEPGAHMLPTLYHQLGLSAELAGRDQHALESFQRAYSGAVSTGDIRAAANAAAEAAYVHTLAGRRPAADAWVARYQALQDASPDIRALRSTIHIVRASALHDELRFEEAAAELDLTSDESWPEHWASVIAHRVLIAAFAGTGEMWELLSRLDSAAMEHAAQAGGLALNRFMLDYVRSLVLVLGGQPERALPVVNSTEEHDGGRLTIGQRAVIHYALGDFDKAGRDADVVLATMRAFPRPVTKALIVRAGVAWRRGELASAADFYRQGVAIALENRIYSSIPVIPLADTLAIVQFTYPYARPDALQRVLDLPQSFVPPVVVLEKLTPQEQRVLSELAAGRTVVQAATRLGISENTAKVHARSIYRKLNAGSRADVLAEAARRGLI